MADRLSQLDANQVIRRAGATLTDPDAPLGGGLAVINVGGTLVPERYDGITLTYVAAGNGVGEIETVTYALDGTDFALLTLGYDASNRLTSVVRTDI